MNIKWESLFSPMHGIRYITNLDDRFQANRFPGTLMFYPGNPLYLLDVVIFNSKERLNEEDIEITVGDKHCTSLIGEEVRKKKDLIFEMCKSYYRPYFILDLEQMKIVEPEDFTETLPIRGINTLFRFENILNSAYFMLVNPTKSVNDRDFVAWMISYVYSGIFCLSPMFQPSSESRYFMQGISELFATRGNKKQLYISTDHFILDAPMNDIGDYDIEVPGNKSDRFSILAAKALEQMKPKKGKK